MTNRLLDAAEVAERLNVPVSWVRESKRSLHSAKTNFPDMAALAEARMFTSP